MGYDVTFHPVGERELERYLAEVVTAHRGEGPVSAGELPARRAAELAPEGPGRTYLVGLYEDLRSEVPRLLAGEGSFANTCGFAAAAVAGFLHPYWYARGAALSFLAFEDPAFRGFLRPLQPRFTAFSGMPRDSGSLEGNRTGGGHVANAHLPLLLRRLEEPSGTVEQHLGEDGRRALRCAARYALVHGLGLIEATDVVVPFSGEFCTSHEHLRASHLRNQSMASSHRHAPALPDDRPDEDGSWLSPEARLVRADWRVELADRKLALAAADAFARARLPQARRLYGGGELLGADDVHLDDVWGLFPEQDEGRLVVVAAKAGDLRSRTLVTQDGQRVEEGTRGYLEEAVRLLGGQHHTADLARRLQEGLDGGRVTYYESRQNLREDGSLVPEVEVSRFSLS